MRITDIAFSNFRNYERLELPGLADLVIFCGPNAVGKTNILEGVHLLTAASSFRHAQINQLIMSSKENARILADMSDGSRQLQVKLELEPGKKRYSVNGKAKAAADVRGTLPAVSFVPDDLELAKKSSSIRRDALDNLGIQVSKSYGVVVRDYEKALRYKNRLLKDEASSSLIAAMNETLVTVGAQLYCFRRALYDRIIPLVQENYRQLAQSGETFSASYLPSWLRMQQRFPTLLDFPGESADELSRECVSTYIYDALARLSDEERRARRSHIGPHNDQITFYLDENDASQFASQGQQRSIVLAWKLAEVALVRQMTGTNPILLLDDVMSELDESRRARLVQTVQADIQTFITATDLTPFNPTLLDRAQIIHLPL